MTIIGHQTAKTLLFVYGTLKRDFYNYDAYLKPAVHHRRAAFLGAGRTSDAYPLVVRGPRHIPALLDRPGDGHRVRGEVYRISDRTLRAMDLLEGVSNGHYVRKETTVALVGGEEEEDDDENDENDKDRERLLTCWVYLQDVSTRSAAVLEDDIVYHRSYTPDLHDLYIPPTAEPDPEILALLSGGTS
mmetsp:Transcript_51055/g.153459  ORF Transcript_51055/g.153459 Transcript_51055/m.153459 type:complete len:188 (-) Transcript_51055:705-1268(-)